MARSVPQLLTKYVVQGTQSMRESPASRVIRILNHRGGLFFHGKLRGQLFLSNEFLVQPRGDERIELKRSESVRIANRVEPQHYAVVGRRRVTGSETPTGVLGSIHAPQRYGLG